MSELLFLAQCEALVGRDQERQEGIAHRRTGHSAAVPHSNAVNRRRGSEVPRAGEGPRSRRTSEALRACGETSELPARKGQRRAPGGATAQQRRGAC